jgi:RNA polymerase sigma-70 factor (ECF subfamily)
VTPTDAQLVVRALDGSQDAYRQLVERHGRSVLNLVARMVREDGVAEELAQDAFVKAFSALRSFDPAYKFSNWILRIAHNTAIDYLRKVRPATVSIDADPSGQDLADALIDKRDRSPFEQTVQGGLREDLEAALEHLRPEYRRLVIMRYLEDLSYEDIAETVGLPLGTVKSHLHRARAALARVMTEAGWGPETDGPAQECNPERGPARRTG